MHKCITKVKWILSYIHIRKTNNAKVDMIENTRNPAKSYRIWAFYNIDSHRHVIISLRAKITHNCHCAECREDQITTLQFVSIFSLLSFSFSFSAFSPFHLYIQTPYTVTRGNSPLPPPQRRDCEPPALRQT